MEPAPLNDKPIIIQAESTAPLGYVDRTLREKFAEDVASQIDRMDALAKQLIVLELAIPSVYATMLKLTSGGGGSLDDPFFLALAFVVWLAALGFTLSSIIPQKQQLDQDSLTAIQDYFSRNATRKWQCLMVASIATFMGIAFAVVAMFVP